MTQERIKQLLAEGEGLTIEYKKCEDSLSNSVYETVCSFSNRYGGYIILGVDDNGIVVGVNRSAAPTIKKIFVYMLNNPQKISPTLFICLEDAEVVNLYCMPMSRSVHRSNYVLAKYSTEWKMRISTSPNPLIWLLTYT